MSNEEIFNKISQKILAEHLQNIYRDLKIKLCKGELYKFCPYKAFYFWLEWWSY